MRKFCASTRQRQFIVFADKIASSVPTISVDTAISQAEATLNGQFNEHPPSLEFLVKPDGTVALTHVIQIQNEATGAWFEAFVDAHSGDVVSVTDFVTQASASSKALSSDSSIDGQCLVSRPSPHGGDSYRGFPTSH